MKRLTRGQLSSKVGEGTLIITAQPIYLFAMFPKALSISYLPFSHRNLMRVNSKVRVEEYLRINT